VPTKAELESLYQISRDLNMARDVEELLSLLARPAQEAGAQETTLFFVDLNEAGEPEWAELAAAWRLEGEPAMPVGSLIYLPEFPFSHLWTGDPNHVLLVADFATDERIDLQSRQAMNGMGIVATAIVPLLHAGQWLGILSFTWNVPHEFSRQETELYKGFMGLAAPVLASHRLMKNQEKLIAARTLELKKSEQRHRSLVENHPYAISENDTTGIITYANPTYHRIFHYPEGESAIGQTIWDTLATEEEREELRQYLAYLVSQQPAAEPYVSRSLAVDGTPIDLRVDWGYKRDEKGQVVGFISVLSDITEQKRAQEALQAAEWEKQTILDSQLEHVIYQDREHRILWANRAACESVGMTREELAGRYCYEIWPQLDQRCDDCPVAVAMETGQPEEVENTTPDGRVWVIKGYPVRDQQGDIAGGIEITRDVTEVKHAELERKRLQQEIIAAQQRAIKELSTPVIPLMKTAQGGVLVMPLVGSIDSMRARDLMRTLLAGISEHRAKVVILDVTGVPIVDSGVANHLNKTIMAARLKGARTIITGITDAVAETIVDLGIDWTEIETLSDLQTGLIVALGSLGLRLAAR